MAVYETIERERLLAEQRQRSLLTLRSDLASVRMQLALLKLQRALRRKYDPNQPRVPAGNPDGGQWTSEGGGQGTDGDGAVDVDVTGSTGRTRVTEDRPYSVDLKEEEARGGHTIRKHVGKTDEEMLARAKARTLAGPGLSAHSYRHGSFRTLEDANDLTSRTLEQNREVVDEVASGARASAFVRTRFGFPTGREAIRLREPNSAPYMRTTYGVGVNIYHDRRSPRGYSVYTAYPRNE